MLRFHVNLVHRVSPVLAIGPKLRRFAVTHSGLLDALELGTVGDQATVFFFYARGKRDVSASVWSRKTHWASQHRWRTPRAPASPLKRAGNKRASGGWQRQLYLLWLACWSPRGPLSTAHLNTTHNQPFARLVRSIAVCENFTCARRLPDEGSLWLGPSRRDARPRCLTSVAFPSHSAVQAELPGDPVDSKWGAHQALPGVGADSRNSFHGQTLASWSNLRAGDFVSRSHAPQSTCFAAPRTVAQAASLAPPNVATLAVRPERFGT